MAGLALLFLLAVHSILEAKTPGTTYCYVGVCHRVLTLEETAAQVGARSAVMASYYDVPWRDPFNPSLYTSSGELFRAGSDDSAASPIYPDGTRLLVWEPLTGGAAVVRVNNAGPYYTDRLLDLSRGAADKLGLATRGVGRVEVSVLSAPHPHEAAFVAGRVYEPVPGYIGSFASMSDAHLAWTGMPAARNLIEQAGTAHEYEGSARKAQPIVGRIVVIPSNGRTNRSVRGTRVVLLPVKQRRMAVMRAAVAKRSATSKKQASNRR